MTRRTVAAAYVAIVLIVAACIAVILADTPAHDVKVKHPSSQPGPAVPQTGGAR